MSGEATAILLGGVGPAGPPPPYGKLSEEPVGVDKSLYVRTDDGDGGASTALWQKQKGAFVRVGPPAKHASQHATGGSDPITPASIGAGSTAQIVAAQTAAEAAAIADVAGERTRAEAAEASLVSIIEQAGGLPLKLFGAKWDGVTDDSAALQAAINESAARGGVPIILPAGEGRIDSEPVIPKNLFCVIPIRGAGKLNTTVKLTTAMRFLTYAATEPGDTLGHVHLSDFSINGNNQLTLVEHGSSVIIGQKTTSAEQVNVKHVYIHDIRTFNIPGLAKKEGGRRNLEIYSHHNEPGLPLNVIEHIYVGRLELEGGQSGVVIAGQSPSTPLPINVRMRHILIEDIEHNLPEPATETGYNSHVQLAQNAWTDRPDTIIVQRISGSNSGDVGFEADICCIFRDMEFLNERNNAYLLNIYNPAFTGEPVVTTVSATAKAGDTLVKMPSGALTVGRQLLFIGGGVATSEVRTIKAIPGAGEVELTEPLGLEWAKGTWVQQVDDVYSQAWHGQNIRGVRTATTTGVGRILALQNSENVIPCPAVKIDDYDCEITAADVINGEVLNMQCGTANSPTGNPVAVDITMKVNRRNVEYSAAGLREYYPVNLIARGPTVPVDLKILDWHLEGPGNTGAGKLAGKMIRLSSAAVILTLDQVVSWTIGSSGGERWCGLSLNEASTGDITAKVRQHVRKSRITSGGGAQVGVRVGKSPGFAARGIAAKLKKAAAAEALTLEFETWPEGLAVGQRIVVDALSLAKAEVFTVAAVNEGAKTVTLVSSGATPGVVAEHEAGATVALLNSLLVEDSSWLGLGPGGSPVGFEDTNVAMGLRTRGNTQAIPRRPSAIALPGSNKAVPILENGEPGIVAVSEGEVTAVEWSPNGTEWVLIGSFTGCSFPVNPGDYVRLTYAEAPTVRFYPANA